jgi:hypothetical protein
MQRERTPVEVRGGVISGRIVTVLVISSVGAVIALWGVWAIMGMPTYQRHQKQLRIGISLVHRQLVTE